MSFLLSGGSLIYLYVDATNTNVCSFVLSSETANCIFTSSLLSGGSIIFLSVDVTNTLVCSFVLSPSDLCNCLLASSQKDLLGKLQKKTNKPKNKNRSPFSLQIIKTGLFSHLCMHFTGFQPINRSTANSLSCFCSVAGMGPQYLADILMIYIPS